MVKKTNAILRCNTGTTPMFIVRLAVVSCIVLSPAYDAATIEEIRLIGDNNDYISTKSSGSYMLSCVVRNAYNDPLEKIRWYKDGRLVYIWDRDHSIGQAASEFQAHVISEPSETPQNLRFKVNPPFEISGNYTCEVISKEGTVKSNPFPLVVLDLPSDDFESRVSLMSNEEKEIPKQGEDKNCTLLWDFSTPAIYPRPNVTCGYYSYLHDDVTNYVPSGLTMYRFVNGSWQAKLNHIHIQVSEIPRERRLGCTVSIPQTSFKRVVKYQDNLDIDYLIDSEGCPGIFLNPYYRLKSKVKGGQLNCRRDVVPFSAGHPLIVSLSCDENEVAAFFNGSIVESWSTNIECDIADFTWRSQSIENRRTLPIDIENDIPICVPSSNSGNTVEVNWISSFLLFFFGKILVSIYL